MKKVTLPDYQEKQRLLHGGKTSQGDLIGYGDGFLEAGRLSDAVEFYQRANHLEGLGKVKKEAESMGDVMLLMQACKALNLNPTKEEWQKAGETARDLKKYEFALHAFEKAGNDALIGQVRKLAAKGKDIQ